MSTSTANATDAIAYYRQRTATFAQCYCTFLFASGVVGHILNIYIFTRRTLRSNACVRYFLASSIVSCVIVYCTIPLRYLSYTYGIDVFVSSVTVCRLLSYGLACVRYCRLERRILNKGE